MLKFYMYASCIIDLPKSSSVPLAQHKFDANSNNINNNNIHNNNNKKDVCWFPIENRNCWNDKRLG